MRLYRLIIIVLLITEVCIISSCKSGEGDYMYQVNAYEHRKYGQVSVTYLKKSGMVQSWPCNKGKIRFYENNKLLSFTLSEDHLKDNDRIPAGSRVTLYQNGNPEFIRLASETKIQGHRIAGNKWFSATLTFFYGEGRLKEFKAATDTIIGGIPCSNKSEIVLYPDGQLMVCNLNEDISEGEEFFPAGTKVVIMEDRKMYDYSSDIHQSIQSRLNMDTYISEELNEAYELRMNGRINQAYNTIHVLDDKEIMLTPLTHYEFARIKRHKLMGGITDEWADAILRETRISVNMDRYSILFVVFDADCASFAGYRAKERGDSVLARRHYFRAIEGFEGVLRMKPDHHPARLSLVDLYYRLPEFLGGDRELAEKHANELKNHDPIWAARAESILLPNKAKRLEHWEKINMAYGDDPDILHELGRAYLYGNDVVNGDRCYRRAMELDSGKIILLADLARYHLLKIDERTGNFNEHIQAAEDNLLEYLDTEPIQPVEAWCYAKLARIHEMKGMNEEAKKLLAEAKKLDQAYLKQDRLPPMLMYNQPGELTNEYYSYFDKF